MTYITVTYFELVVRCIICAFIMAVASRLCGSYSRHYKNNVFRETLIQILFWGGGSANVAIVSGMSWHQGLLMVPLAISNTMIPAISYSYKIKLTETITIILNLMLFALFSFLPVCIYLGLHGYIWEVMLLPIYFIPLAYCIGNHTSIHIPHMQRGYQLTEFAIGGMFGIFLNLALLRKSTEYVDLIANLF